jgi:hypothetical protein
MNDRHETTKRAVPARHREPTHSGEAGGPPSRRLRNVDRGLRIENSRKSL